MSTIDWSELATAVSEGTQIGRGDKVAVSLTAIDGYEAARSVVRECQRRGALAQVLLSAEDFDRDALPVVGTETLATPSPLELAAIEWADVYISLRPMTPPPATLFAANPARAAAQRVGRGAVSAARWKVDRWIVARIPTTAWAQLAGVDPDRLFDEFAAGIKPPTPARLAGWNALAAQLRTVDTVRILDTDTDLTLRVRGRDWVVFSGEANLPDGELATAPLENEVYGHITFPGPFWFADTLMRDLRLTFEAGCCTDVQASAGSEVAQGLVTADEGSCRIGELGIGLNTDMRTLVGDLFHDEKVLGTAHIALGRAYPQCGGTNNSSIHWDIVKDLRGPSARLLADDLALIEAGRLHPLLNGN